MRDLRSSGEKEGEEKRGKQEVKTLTQSLKQLEPQTVKQNMIVRRGKKME